MVTSKEFTEVLVLYNQNNDPIYKEWILNTLSAIVEEYLASLHKKEKQLVGINDIMNLFGSIKLDPKAFKKFRKEFFADPIVLLSTGLLHYVDYENYKYSIFTQERDYYVNQILRVLKACVAGCNFEEAYERFRNFFKE